MKPNRAIPVLFLAFVAVAPPAFGQNNPLWNKAHKPFHVYGNTYYVGTQGLSAMLITSPDGHILIDGAVPQAATKIATSIRTLGFNVEDVKLILSSHTHFDHAGGIAQLQRMSGARVAASPASAKVLKSGVADRDDPQFGTLPNIAKVANVRELKDKEIVKVGALSLTAHFTPGHAPGGTTWTWQSCEQERCLDIVYADSLTAVSARGYLFSNPNLKPNGAELLEDSFKTVAGLPCHILITPHPEMVDVFGKLAKRGQDDPRDAFFDPFACREYVRSNRDRLETRLREEQGK